MALNLDTFKIRSLSAVIYVIVMLTGLMFSQWSFRLLFILIQFGCVVEFIRLIQRIDPGFIKFPFPVLKYLGLGFLYLSLPFSLLRDLYQHSPKYFTGPNWVFPMIIIVSIWINDTMAYIVGSLIGKTPLSPVSPKKTWEGTIGGAILAVLTVTIAGKLILGFNIQYLILVSVTSAIAGTLGDLLESKIKRLANVKDSGQLMPGHGGFLDRFDSLLVAIPAVWLVFSLFL